MRLYGSRRALSRHSTSRVPTTFLLRASTRMAPSLDILLTLAGKWFRGQPRRHYNKVRPAGQHLYHPQQYQQGWCHHGIFLRCQQCASWLLENPITPRLIHRTWGMSQAWCALPAPLAAHPAQHQSQHSAPAQRKRNSAQDSAQLEIHSVVSLAVYSYDTMMCRFKVLYLLSLALIDTAFTPP